MRSLSGFRISVVLVTASIALTPTYGGQAGWKPPGTAEAEAVEQANKQLDATYEQLMHSLDADQQKSLREAERSWIKWRDDEAVLVARLGGAVGGSSLRVDALVAEASLIRQRNDVLKGYARQVAPQ